MSSDEIVFVLRRTADADATAEMLSVPKFKQQEAYVRTVIELFNRDFELYGRRVVLKTYSGRGSFLIEQSDQGQAEAQADAQTEEDMGAFYSFGGSAVYQAALANKGIISGTAPYTPENVYESYDPFFYGSALWPSSNKWGMGAGEAACQRMNGMPAIYSGDPVYQQTERVWGLTSIEQANYSAGGELFLATSNRACSLDIGQHSEYNYNYTTSAQQARTIVAQMKAAGVTTLVHAGDPLMFVHLTNAAAEQNWHPEYLIVDPLEIVARLADQRQASRAIKLSPFGEFDRSQEMLDAWAEATDGGSEPPQGADNLNYMSYYTALLQAFSSIQMAGPNLNPLTYKQGRQAMPPALGDFGLWDYTATAGNAYNPVADFTLAKYDPAATSKTDGERGAFLACNGRTRYPFVNPDLGTGQLDC